MSTQGNIGKGKLSKPIVFWSDNERDAFRRNRVVQTRCSMILDEISNQRETSKRSIRYEAHKFRQKSKEHLQRARANGGQDKRVISSGVPQLNSNRPILPNQLNHSEDSEDNAIDPDDKDKKEIQFPKMTGIITNVRKPSVRFSNCKTVYNKSGDSKSIATNDKGDGMDDEYKDDCETVIKLKPLPKRSLSAVAFRENINTHNIAFKRQQSAVISRQTGTTFLRSSERNDQTVTAMMSPRSDTFFVKSKAAYQLRQDLRRQASIRRKGTAQKPITLDDYLNVERENYLKSRGKIMEYIKRIDAEKLFRPILINKWTATDIGKQLEV